MKIIILGAGQVGRTAAYHLSREEANEVTVVDSDEAVLQQLQDRLDVRTVSGNAASPSVLAAAGCADADLLVALTSSDEVNMVACQVAWTLFKTPTKIARIRAASYAAHPELFGELTGFAVDTWLSPEQLVTEYVERLIEHPGALQVVDFADGRVRLVGVRAVEGGLLVGQPLSNLPKHIPGVETRVAAMYRRGRSVRPDGETLVESGDEVFFLAAREDIRTVMNELRKLEAKVRRVVIAGAGHIGIRLAQALEGRLHVKLIERDKQRARRAAEVLREAIVLQGDAADEELLIEENVDSADVFVAVTNAEEANILSAMLAKRIGCRKVMALINRPAYAELMESDRVDIAISPQTITIGSLLAHVRRGDVVKVHSLRRGAAEAIEAIAHGDRETSQVVGRPVEAVRLPDGTTIGAIVRGDDVIMAHHNTVIEEGDHVIMFLTDRRHVEAVEKLFQVGVSFL
ncbi:MAG: Trk system potassium transporter TrkA [Pseudomonadota bacterium]